MLLSSRLRSVQLWRPCTGIVQCWTTSRCDGWHRRRAFRNVIEIFIGLGFLVVLFMSFFVYFLINQARGGAESNEAELGRDIISEPIYRSAQKHRLAGRSVATTQKRIGRRIPSKPALLCGLVAPGRLPSGANDQSWVPWTELPEPSLCDYIILDVERNRDGSYNESEYHFLLEYNTTAKILFTLSSEPFFEVEATFHRKGFRNSAAKLYETPGVRGFGLLDGDSGTPGWAITHAAIMHAVHLFSKLKRSLVAVAYEESVISNFLAIRPIGLRQHFQNFSQLLSALDGVVNFLILLSISAPRPTCFVEAVAAWNQGYCFMRDDVQPTMEECLRLITSVDMSTSQFALTLTLRVDAFVDVEHPLSSELNDVRRSSVGKSCYIRTHRFVRRGVCPPAEQQNSTPSSTDLSRSCPFAARLSQNEWQVQSFETQASIENKMTLAYKKLSNDNDTSLSWLLYNVTLYVADGSCPSEHTRIYKAWEVVQRFRRH